MHVFPFYFHVRLLDWVLLLLAWLSFSCIYALILPLKIRAHTYVVIVSIVILIRILWHSSRTGRLISCQYRLYLYFLMIIIFTFFVYSVAIHMIKTPDMRLRRISWLRKWLFRKLIEHLIRCIIFRHLWSGWRYWHFILFLEFFIFAGLLSPLAILRIKIRSTTFCLSKLLKAFRINSHHLGVICLSRNMNLVHFGIVVTVLLCIILTV